MKTFVNGLKNTSGALTAAVLSAAMIISMFPAGALAEEIEITPEFSVEESVETEVNVADEIISENHDEEIFTADHEDVLLSGDIDNDKFHSIRTEMESLSRK
ncbi:MAG: hypothetical protein K6F53_08505 [Lachnospiraceae bacterium]|nr:hypothetical protein [Lachnospiraceae bacterium]